MSNNFIVNRYFLIPLVLAAFCSCKPWSSETEAALKLAGENRVQLEKVLRYYNEVDPDPMKFKAAEYLIANMTYRYTIFGPAIDSLNKGYEYVYGVYTKDRNPVFSSDSVQRMMKGEKDAEYDLKRLSADQLIEQIEAAFEACERFEWCKAYPFELFCEYILPYKIGNSDPVDWRRYAYEKYGDLLDHAAFDGTNAYFEAEHFATDEAFKVAVADASEQYVYHLQEGQEPLEIEFEIQQEGVHIFNVHYMNGHSTAGKVRIMIDSLTVGDWLFPATGDWQKIDKEIPPVSFTQNLHPGKHRLKLITVDKDIFIDFVHIPEYIKMKLPEAAIPEGTYYLSNSFGRITVDNDTLINEGGLKVRANSPEDWPVKLVALDGNLYQIALERNGLKKAIDAFPFGDSDWVLVYNDHGYQNQQWAFIPADNGGYQVRNKETGKILAYSEADSSLIQLPADSMRTAYAWHLEKVGEWADTIDMSVRAAQKISDITDRFHWSGSTVEIGPINPTYILDYPYGSCVEEVNFQTMVLRSMGVACAVDFVFNYPERDAGHSWSVIFDKEGNTIQNNCHNPVGAGTWVDIFAKGKVYRNTTAINKESLFIINNGKESIPAQFQNPYIKDVTKEYCDVRDFEIDIAYNTSSPHVYGYLMVFNNDRWVATTWGENIGSAVRFKDVEPRGMYLPAFYVNGDFQAFNEPFYFDSTGNIHHVNRAEEQYQQLSLKRKFPNRSVDESLHARVIGGRFEGANKHDFSDAVTIGTITEHMLDPVFHVITVSDERAFRYLRYIGPEGGHSNINEIVFFDTAGDRISGEIIGTDGSFENNGNTKEKAFDGDVLTYFDAPAPTGDWVGLKLKSPKSIGMIRFLTRNDGNMVEVGDEYELVYWGDRKWESLGRQIATTDSLGYEKVPKNALYHLKNHTKGWEERIFTYEDGKQVWW